MLSILMQASMAVNPARPTAYISTNDGSTTNPLVTGDHKGKALLQRQEEVIKMQDEMLSEIESGVDRLHGQAKAMGEEITSQTAVIDNLDTKVDIATVALQEETRHAQEIKEKGKVCYLYICIAVEVVIIVLASSLCRSHLPSRLAQSLFTLLLGPGDGVHLLIRKFNSFKNFKAVSI